MRHFRHSLDVRLSVFSYLSTSIFFAALDLRDNLTHQPKVTRRSRFASSARLIVGRPISPGSHVFSGARIRANTCPRWSSIGETKRRACGTRTSLHVLRASPHPNGSSPPLFFFSRLSSCALVAVAAVHRLTACVCVCRRRRRRRRRRRCVNTDSDLKEMLFVAAAASSRAHIQRIHDETIEPLV
jgi:hypothetical protein